MPKASEVATELRKLADALDREPEAKMDRPLVFFYPEDKQMFLNQARIFPKPLTKVIEDPDGSYPKMCLENKGKGIWLRTVISRDVVCKVVKPATPAVYDCEPLLSQDEEESLMQG
jgi:hypothetical protein